MNLSLSPLKKTKGMTILLTPAVVNDPEVTERVQAVAQRVFPDHQLESDHRTMGSEDMAFMMEGIPSCYIFVGANNAEKGLDFPHHHPKFDFDEAVLPQAVALMAAVVVEHVSP